MNRRQFGSIETRGGRPGFYVRFRWRGRRFQRYGGMTAAIALKRLSTLQSMLEGGIDVDAAFAQVFRNAAVSQMTFRDAVSPYLAFAATRKKPSTICTDTQRLAFISKASWARLPLGEVRVRDLEQWAQSRLGPNTAGPTVNRDLNLASALFKWAVRMGHVADNPVRRVERFSEKGRARELWLDADEATALIQACDPYFRPVVLAAVRTGMRLGELLSLTWRAVDLKRNEITVEAQHEKTSRGRVIPIGPVLRQVLVDLRAARSAPTSDGSDRVFRSRTGQPLTEGARRHAYEAAVRRAKSIPEHKRSRLTFHALRHTAASLMTQQGVPPLELMKIMGWKTLSMVARYAHLAPGAGRSAIEKLERAFEAPASLGGASAAGEAVEAYEARRSAA